MIIRKLVVNQGKMQQMGGGSVREFSKKYNIEYATIANIKQLKGTKQVKGSKNQIAIERLIEMGVAYWVDVDTEAVA
jgi:hypothetical protein